MSIAAPVVDHDAPFVRRVAELYALDVDALSDPYPIYAAMRAEAPVLRLADMVSIARYDDVKTVLRDYESFTSDKAEGSAVRMLRERLPESERHKLDEVTHNMISLWMASLDGAPHARLRGFVDEAFSAGRIAQLREQVEAISAELLDPLSGGVREFDLVSSYAFPLPLRVISALLGADPDDALQLRAWSDTIGIGIGTNWSNLDDAYEAVVGFRRYVVERIERARSGPRADTLFGELVQTRNEGGAYLSDDDLVSMFVHLVFAGHETTTNLIGNALNALLRHPDQLELLRARPELIRPAADEFLRFCPSIQGVHRTVTREIEIGGVVLQPGETVRLLLASANRDDSIFERPDELDVTRRNARKHLGLGYGIHTCLGAWLTRLEMEIALRDLLARFSSIELVDRWRARPVFTLHGAERLTLRVS